MTYRGINGILDIKVYDIMFDEEHIKKSILNFIYQCIYPGIFEETLYRGFLISGKPCK